MTQREMVLDYLFMNPYMIPAKMSGSFYNGQIWGSEVSRVCRTLRAEGKLRSERCGKFEKFYF